MRKVLLAFFVVLLNLDSCNGQLAYLYVQQQIDSLERIKPSPLNKVSPKGCAYIIKVKNQEQFDRINDDISKAVADGRKNIQVKIANGVYRFHEGHISRKDERGSDISITITGDKVYITSDADYVFGKGINNPWQDLVQLDTIIDIYDKENGICFIPYKNNYNKEEIANFSKVQITQWFRAPIYNVNKIDRNGIFFSDPDLEWDGSNRNAGYSVNYDYLYLGKNPRFRLYNKENEASCNASQFLALENCSYHLFHLCGINFISNGASDALIKLNNVKAQRILVSHCSFEYIRGSVIDVSGTGNVAFDHNTVKFTLGNEVRFVNNSPNVRVTNNKFVNCGQGIGNTFCVTCWESSYYIANNIFCDFGFGAIGVGVWYGFEKKWPSGGIIEFNEMYFTPQYFSESWKHLLMDSGAIYTWTQNDRLIIRYNYIHDYTGPGSNRGVFCDDGAFNLKIYSNVVLNIPNSYCIDSRCIPERKKELTNNANNIMAYNMVDGSVRFQGHKSSSRHAIKGENFVVQNDMSKQFDNKYDNLEIELYDIRIDDLAKIKGQKNVLKNMKTMLKKNKKRIEL